MSSRVKVFGNTEIVLKGGIGVFPNAEKINFAADLLTPLAVVVRGKRE